MDPQSPDPEQEFETVRATLARGLEALRLHGPPETDKLAKLCLLLAEWAPRMNLTGHRGAEEIARRLVLDAVALISVLPDFRTLADLGSGAGFPGLPIAILFPDRALISVESRSRRCAFQKTAVRTLGLGNVTILQRRIEDPDPQPVDAVLAQAVAPPDRILDLMLPWASPGGWMAVPGTPESLSSPPVPAPGQDAGEIRPYRVPLDGVERRVWLTRTR